MSKTIKWAKAGLSMVAGAGVLAAALYGLLYFGFIDTSMIPGLSDKDGSKTPAKQVHIDPTSDAPPKKPAGKQLSAEQVYSVYNTAVVHVNATIVQTKYNFFGMPVPEEGRAQGSGFFVDDKGYVVTNAHVVEGANSINVVLEDQTKVEAELVGIDFSTDLAVLKIDPAGHEFKVIDMGNSEKLNVGQTVYAIGNPFGLDRSMSQGIISALEREITAPNGFPIRNVIQTDAAVNPGNSGGPLIDAHGEVVGVTSQIASASGNNAGIAFAVPSNTVKDVYSQIIVSGSVAHPWLGISGYDLDEALVDALDLSIEKGVVVAQVFEGSPAADAKIKGGDKTIIMGQREFSIGGDIIIAIDGKPVSTMQELLRQVEDKKVGDQVEVQIFRDGSKGIRKITLAKRPENVRD